jgi:hypothetical protein
METRILEALKGSSVRKVAERFSINPSTVQRIKSPLGVSTAA